MTSLFDVVLLQVQYYKVRKDSWLLEQGVVEDRRRVWQGNWPIIGRHRHEFLAAQTLK